MLADMSTNELSKELEKLIGDMKNRGLLPGLDDPKKLADTVANTLANDKDLNLLKADLAADKMRGALTIAITGQHTMDKTPGYKFDYQLLFKAPTPENQKKLKEELVNLLKQTLLEQAKKNPELQKKLERNGTQIDKALNQLVDNMLKDEFKNIDDKAFSFEGNTKLLMKIMDMQDLLVDQLREDRISRYSMDTHNPGSYTKPVLGNPEGNRMGFQDYENNITYSFAGRENLIKPDYGLPDPNGTIWATILDFIGINADTVESDLEKSGIMPGDTDEPSHSRSSFNPSPLSTKLVPPGHSDD